MLRLFESNGACGGRVPPPKRQSTQFIETTRELCRLLSPANDQFIGQFVASIHPGAVILWGRPSCILKEAFFFFFRFIFCIIWISRNTITNRKFHAVPFKSLPLGLPFSILAAMAMANFGYDRTPNSNTMATRQLTRYWKHGFLVRWLIPFYISYSHTITTNNTKPFIYSHQNSNNEIMKIVQNQIRSIVCQGSTNFIFCWTSFSFISRLLHK